MKKIISAVACTGFLTSSIVSAQDNLHSGYFGSDKTSGIYYETTSGIIGLVDKGLFNYKKGDEIAFYLSDNKKVRLAMLAAQEVISFSQSSSNPEHVNRLVLLFEEISTQGIDVRSLTDDEANKLSELLSGSSLSNADAAQLLIEGEAYAKKQLRSQHVVFEPYGAKLTNYIVNRKRWDGTVCYFDADKAADQNYWGPIGRTQYMIDETGHYEYPDVKDDFDGCDLEPQSLDAETYFEVVEDASEWDGIVACAEKGCTRSDLSGYQIEAFDDDGDFKYRSIARTYDEKSHLLMEKTQGMGAHPKLDYPNLQEQVWLTSLANNTQTISFDGAWMLNEYASLGVNQTCLYISGDQVFKGDSEAGQCSNDAKDYFNNVTNEFGDMWWLKRGDKSASIAALNAAVKWSDANNQVQYTSWEFLPIEPTWRQGSLYRFALSSELITQDPTAMPVQAISELKRVEK